MYKNKCETLLRNLNGYALEMAWFSIFDNGYWVEHSENVWNDLESWDFVT